MERTVRAPGKLFVLGEYAVLDGAPALVAAVDRGVACLISEGDGIETPGDDRFVRAALEAIDAPRALYRFRDWNAPGLDQKGGFGGSAAAVVAACVAGGCRDIATMVRIHGEVQGSGSGMDVRASVSGGLRRYRGEHIGPLLEAPALLAVYSGASASTGPRVLRYQAWSGRDEFVARSEALVEAFPESPIEVLAEAFALLCAMGRDAGVDYLTEAHARIAELARAHHGAAKPSGAGGGDVAVALFPSTTEREDFARACALEGLVPVPVRIVDGVSDA